MPEALEKIQNIFKEAKTFALLSKKGSEDYKFLAQEALKCALSEKKVGFFSFSKNPELQEKWGAILKNTETSQPARQTSIRIPKEHFQVKELSCQEDDQYLSLIITSENGELPKNAVLFEPILPKVEAVFCFFDPPQEETLREFEHEISFPPKEKIIFLTSNGMTFAEKIYQIIKAINPNTPVSSDIATFLFASLITETNNFVRPVSQEVLLFGSELLSAGADKETIKNILNEEKTLSFARLLGRALARTHVDNAFNASWTFLAEKDFEKTDNLRISPSFLYGIVQKLREIIPTRTLSFLFWQDKNNIFAMAAADEEESLIPLAKQLGTSLNSKFFTAGPFANFSEAELRFRKALEETVSLKI